MTKFEASIRERLHKLDADYVKHREALLIALACETGKDPGALVLVEVPPRPFSMLPPEARNQMDNVKAAIDLLAKDGDGSFTKDTVRDVVKAMKPDISENVLKNMAGFLWQLHKHEGFIKIVEKGQGQKPSIYVKAKT